MKKTYVTPIMHFIPLVDDVNAKDLSEMSVEEQKRVIDLCKSKENNKVYQISPDVIKRQVENEWILLPTGNLAQRFHGIISLSEVGNYIWEQLQYPKTLTQILAAVKEEFSDDNHVMEIETRKFIDDYSYLGFLNEQKKD